MSLFMISFENHCITRLAEMILVLEFNLAIINQLQVKVHTSSYTLLIKFINTMCKKVGTKNCTV